MIQCVFMEASGVRFKPTGACPWVWVMAVPQPCCSKEFHFSLLQLRISPAAPVGGKQRFK